MSSRVRFRLKAIVRRCRFSYDLHRAREHHAPRGALHQLDGPPGRKIDIFDVDALLEARRGLGPQVESPCRPPYEEGVEEGALQEPRPSCVALISEFSPPMTPARATGPDPSQMRMSPSSSVLSWPSRVRNRTFSLGHPAPRCACPGCGCSQRHGAAGQAPA